MSNVFENPIPVPSRIEKVWSYGKKILFTLSSGDTLVSSLGMVGKWKYEASDHCHLFLEIGEDGLTIYYDDYRYMGGVKIVKTTSLPSIFNEMGPDLLSDFHPPISFQEWVSRWSREKKIQKWQICHALMSGGVVAGIGNYLKSEILYRSRIHPARVLNTLSVNDWYQIYVQTYVTIQESYASNGLTIHDYWAPDGTKGTFKKQVYGQKFDPLGHEVIKGTFQDSRTSHFVPYFQRL
jgi:formamidopyrimidine-DNA glycosylase